MINTDKNSITYTQFVLIITGIQISVAVLSLPRKLAEAAGSDGWLALPLGFILNLVCSYIIVAVMRSCSGRTLIDTVSAMMGKWIGKAFALALAFYFLNLMYDGLVRAILIVKIWLMPNTQAYVLMLLLLFPAYKIALGGPRIIGRYAELVTVISCWLPFVYLFTLKYAHWLNLLPFFKEGFLPVLYAVKSTIYPTLGLAAVFILYPYLKNKEKAAPALFISNMITTTVYLFITIICFIYYSPHESKFYNDPIISILKTIEFRFIERIEIPFISFYLFVFSLVWIPSMYIVSYCMSLVFELDSHRTPLRVLCIVLIVGTFFYMPTFNQSDKIQHFLTWFGFSMEYVLPSILLIAITIYNRYRPRNAL
ncbi:GerAB/ArcD/ProY family transporter [Paenibacillus sinopodophylli]|uniref:GerAB/ArcD/ProY family transporter n=1 Tax=Paenibacillus sinopodophylli TaxID=1837342 RepID=UPI001486859C|nr:endospore germination permease [Paenibacillus sinopodophylli]